MNWTTHPTETAGSVETTWVTFDIMDSLLFYEPPIRVVAGRRECSR